MISLLSRQLGQCIVAGRIPEWKGVFRAESCFGCVEGCFCHLQEEILILPP